MYKVVVTLLFLGLFGAWCWLEFTHSSHAGLKDAIFWGALGLMLLSGFEFPRRKS